jgi:hypothetical protein
MLTNMYLRDSRLEGSLVANSSSSSIVIKYSSSSSSRTSTIAIGIGSSIECSSNQIPCLGCSSRVSS